MKTDFEARPVCLNREDRIKAHFLTCFLALLHFRLLNHSLEEQGYIPIYERQEITDYLHETCGFRMDCQFITNYVKK